MASIKPSRAYKRVLFISKSTSMINFWFKRHNFYALDGAWADLFWSKNNKKILITVMIDIDSRLYTNTSFTSMSIKIKTWFQYSLPANYITTENVKRAIFVLIFISSLYGLHIANPFFFFCPFFLVLFLSLQREPQVSALGVSVKGKTNALQSLG